MTYLITGAAGFIGFHLAGALLKMGEKVIGIDNLNDYYSPELKQARLQQLIGRKGFEFYCVDVADASEIKSTLTGKPVKRIVHLAAQAGVRYSIENPQAYVHSNLTGHANMLEYARHLDGLEHMAYASSSSVYGQRSRLPFFESDCCDEPVSFYAATKKSGELMGHAYSSLYGVPLTGMRFFTVYGPWGRPDMAYWLFTRDIIHGNVIGVFNNGDMLRDFTYIDDAVKAVCSIITKGHVHKSDVPHFIYNIGNNHPEKLGDFIKTLEDIIGKKAVWKNLPMQSGDVTSTYADISRIACDYGFKPETDLKAGLERYVNWYRQYH